MLTHRYRIWLIPLAAAVLLTGGCTRRGQDTRQPFDATAWRAQGDAHAPRHAMVDDLISSDRLKGLTRTQVVALLGEPTATDKFREWSMAYRLGGDRTYLPITPSWLVINLSEDQVTAFARTED